MADVGADVDPKPEGGFEWPPKFRSATFAVGVYELSWPVPADPESISRGFRPSCLNHPLAYPESFRQKHHHPGSNCDHVAQKQRYGGAREKAFSIFLWSQEKPSMGEEAVNVDLEQFRASGRMMLILMPPS